MAAKISVLGMILSSYPYLRSAMLLVSLTTIMMMTRDYLKDRVI